MPDTMRRISLWDLPVRLTHWSFAALLPALWWSGEYGKIDLHKTLGLIMLGLVLFRILWGLIGSQTARFSQFIKGPGTVIAYLRGLRGGGEAAPSAGHNPVGAISVVLMLGLLAAQVTIGLFTQDEDMNAGPLNAMVTYETAEQLRGLHGLLFNVILLFVVLHIAAILFYTFVKKDSLVPPMITGKKDLPESIAAPKMAPLWRAIPLLVIAAAFSWWLGKGAPTSLEQLNAPPPPDASEYM